MKKSSSQSDFELLRKKAEEAMNQKTLESKTSINEVEILKLVHELEVHQIELELQNDELIKAKQEAQEAAKKFIELFDFAPIGYFTLTKEGEIIELNFSGASMLGKPRSQLIHGRFGTFVSKQNKHDFIEFLNSVFENGNKKTYELLLEPEGADPKWVHLTGIVAENGIQCHLNVLDITDRKQAEKTIINRRKMLRTLIDNLPDMIYIKDVACRIVIANIADVRNIGYPSEEEVLGKTDLELFHGEIGEHRYKNDQKVINSGKAIINQVEYFLNKEGKRCWMLTTKIPLRNNEGEITGLIGIGHDITERKRIEEELTKAKEKAEESDRLKSAFLANMSHEIRTPMNGILGFTELLKAPKLNGETQQRYIDIIEKSGNRLLSIINDIVSISKVESGQIDISISATNIDEQLEYVNVFFRPEAEKKGIRLLCKKGLSEQKTIVQTDREKIYAVLINLVKNAIKFTHEGSIEFGFEKKENYLEFFVKDTGPGITKKQSKIIFERFRQGCEFQNQSYEGAGLGLSISKAYVELLGGKIWVESKLGEGAVFYFTIPYDSVNSQEITPKKQGKLPQKTLAPIKDLKILIVEDDKTSAILLQETIKEYGREIISVKTGSEAVEVCRSHPNIDFILMDLQMPGMDGYEATRQIRMFNDQVIVIAQTAFEANGNKEKALNAGCDDYVTKPFNRKMLATLLEKHFKRNR